jgi:hypothetical protein
LRRKIIFYKYDSNTLPKFDIRNIIDVVREAVVVVPPVPGSIPGTGFPEM